MNKFSSPKNRGALVAESPFGNSFFQVVVGSTALGLGCMAAAIESLRRISSGFAFHLSGGTFVAFAGGLLAGIFFWKLIGKGMFAARVGAVFLLLIGLAGFLYPLRFVQADKRSEIAAGLGMAAVAISVGAVMLWKMKGFFDADTAAGDHKSVN